MYWPSTLSWDGAGCCGCGVGPPLVVVMIRYPPSPAGIPHRAAWLTQGARPDKDHESVFFRLRVRGGNRSRLMGLDRFRHLVPLVGRKIDDRSGSAVARCFLTARANAAPIQSARPRHEQQRAHHVGNKSRQHQENPPHHGGKPRSLQIDGLIPCAPRVLRENGRSRAGPRAGAPAGRWLRCQGTAEQPRASRSRAQPAQTPRTPPPGAGERR